MRHEVESVHQVKEEMDDLRDCIDKLQEQNRRRKMRLLEQVFWMMGSLLKRCARKFSFFVPHVVLFCTFPLDFVYFRPSTPYLWCYYSVNGHSLLLETTK